MSTGLRLALPPLASSARIAMGGPQSRRTQ
jgi:hypothetical protein